jgi:mevalonate kinase
LSRTYPSKLLLFGEYTVLNGGQALAVPLTKWQGIWQQKEKVSIHEESPLYTYISWLQSHDLISAATAAHMISDAEEGWIFESNIPIGYGLGSSGAFVAALYDRYVTKEKPQSSMLQMLSKMEGFFHGSSSGMDPLVSFSGNAVYKSDQGIVQQIKDPGWPENYQLYLLNSRLDRTTGPLVHAYKEYLKDTAFRMKIERELIPSVDHAIHGYLNGSGQLLEEFINLVSQFQREHFSMMIPDHVKDQWDELVEAPGVYVKLCGAGGGGYFQVIKTTPEPLSSSGNLIQIM